MLIYHLYLITCILLLSGALMLSLTLFFSYRFINLLNKNISPGLVDHKGGLCRLNIISQIKNVSTKYKSSQFIVFNLIPISP